MKLHYMKKFNGDLESLPQCEHKPGAVQFKEPEDMKKLGLLANGIATVMYFVTLPILYLIGGLGAFDFFACIVVMLSLFPHEILHGICFKRDVYLYTNLKNGMLFVVGAGDYYNVYNALRQMPKGARTYMSGMHSYWYMP